MQILFLACKIGKINFNFSFLPVASQISPAEESAFDRVDKNACVFFNEESKLKAIDFK